MKQTSSPVPGVIQPTFLAIQRTKKPAVNVSPEPGVDPRRPASRGAAKSTAGSDELDELDQALTHDSDVESFFDEHSFNACSCRTGRL